VNDAPPGEEEEDFPLNFNGQGITVSMFGGGEAVAVAVRIPE
jgi:hypothetical protein